jgi:kynurenine formamidase
MSEHCASGAAPLLGFRELGRRLSNWGRWGRQDRLGTLNLITPERLVQAAGCIRSGKLFDLGIPVNSQGPQLGGARANPSHLMSITPLDLRGRPDGLIVADDYIFMPLQSVTQWDGLGHVGYDGLLYNDISAQTITSLAGSTELSIEQIAAKGIAGRGVLLDIARHRKVDALQAGDAIYPAELEAVAKQQNVAVGAGDILLLRTGWLTTFTVHGSRERFWNGQPGITAECAEWLRARDVAAIGCDNWGVEVVSPDTPDYGLPFHCVAIRDMGMTLGEIFDLERLAQDCALDEVWDFFFSAPPLKVSGGVGSPITPLAIK